ncbi:MAG: transposase [Pseudomonadota bacterium]
MGKPLPLELRQRVVAFVEEGHTHRAAAARLRVSIKFVNDMVLLKRSTGLLDPKPQGNGGGHGKLAGVAGWIERRIRQKRDLTLDELVVDLRGVHGVEAQRVLVWRHLRGLGLTHKKTCAPPSRSGLMQKRPDVARARCLDQPSSAFPASHADKTGLH